MPQGVQVNMNERDEQLFVKCLDTYLNNNSIEKMRFMTSTQKCESINLTYSKCNPKRLTFHRTAPGRIHTANSVCEIMGLRIPSL